MTDRSKDAGSTLDAAWEHYAATVAEARAAVQGTARYRERPEHRAPAFRALAEAQAMAYSFAIAPLMDPPQVYSNCWYSHIYVAGGTSPDFYMGALFLDGRRTYKVSGRFGDLKLILLQVYPHLLGHPRSKMLANADVSTFDVRSDGSFEATISATRQPGNWIPLDAASDYNFVLVRRMTGDWYGDRGELDIVAMDGATAAANANTDLDEAAMARRIAMAADFSHFLVRSWNIGIYDLYLSTNGGRKNVLRGVPGESIASDYAGSPSTNYFFGIYEIEEDEALIVDIAVPQADYWSLQVMDVWCRPFEFVNHQTDVNMVRAAIDGDGRYRAVVSLSDPGVANWLDPCGRKEGTLTGRNYHSPQMPPTPITKVVKLADLRRHLPADTKYVTPAQRRQALDYRRRGYFKLFGE